MPRSSTVVIDSGPSSTPDYKSSMFFLHFFFFNFGNLGSADDELKLILNVFYFPYMFQVTPLLQIDDES
jgi:hypothetical protein